MEGVDVILVHAGERVRVFGPDGLGALARLEWAPTVLGLSKYAPLPEVMRDVEVRLGRPISSYGLVVGRYLNPVSKLVLPTSLPTIVDLDDVGYRYTSAAVGGWKGLLGHMRASVHQHISNAAHQRFRAFFFVSERDRMAYPRLHGWVLPNVPFRGEVRPRFASAGKTVLFVGALWYGPNREGIEHFLRCIWPRVRERETEAQLILAGAAPESDRRRWGRVAGVSAPGFVADLGEAYGAAAFCVAPIYSGGGSNIKVLEAYAYGRACVTTPFCHEGLKDGFVGSGDLVVASSDEEFVDACGRLLGEPKIREGYARAGHHVVQRYYSRDRFRRTVAEAVREVGGGSNGGVV